jgi:hypothetical protein
VDNLELDEPAILHADEQFVEVQIGARVKGRGMDFKAGTMPRRALPFTVTIRPLIVVV